MANSQDKSRTLAHWRFSEILLKMRLAFNGGPSRPITPFVIGTNLNLDPIVASKRRSEDVSSFLYLAARGETYVRGSGRTERNELAIAIAIMNVIAPMTNLVPLEEADAQARFRLQGLALIFNELNRVEFYEVSEEAYAAALVENAPLYNLRTVLPENLKGFTPEMWQAALTDSDVTTPSNVAQALRWIITKAKPKLSCIHSTLFILAFVSFSKRGRPIVVQQKCALIRKALVDDGCPDPELTREVVQVIRRHLSFCVTETNAQEVFTGLSPKIRNTLNRTGVSALTALCVVRKAIMEYKNFPWAKAFKMIPGEADRLTAALTAVNSNPYYGFKSDLGAAKWNNYRSIAYVSKELLRKHGGPEHASLNRYVAWARNPKKKARLDALIAAYRPDANSVKAEDHKRMVESITKGLYALLQG